MNREVLYETRRSKEKLTQVVFLLLLLHLSSSADTGAQIQVLGYARQVPYH
jgi:hypothetical protein